jgi:hypothetical protein
MSRTASPLSTIAIAETTTSAEGKSDSVEKKVSAAAESKPRWRTKPRQDRRTT